MSDVSPTMKPTPREVPRWQRLSELAQVFSGIFLPRQGEGAISMVELPLIRTRDLSAGLPQSPGELQGVRVKTGPATDRCRVEASDLVLTGRGTQHPFALVPAELEGALASSDLLIVRMTGPLHPEVLLAYLKSPPGDAALQKLISRSTATSQISVAALKELLVPVPHEDVQAKVKALVQATEEGYRAAAAAAELRRAIGYRVAAEWLSHDEQGKG